MQALPHTSTEVVTANGRAYRRPKQPTVVVCFDGCDPEYIRAARSAGAIPALERMMREGFAATAHAAMPTFTNPNNISIVCGAPPVVHGVSGNYYLDAETGREIMMVDSAPMRAPTILSAFSRLGVDVVAVTAKDKLRKALGAGLEGIAFSAEKAETCTVAENGIERVTELVGRPAPDQYSADLSLFVLDSGIRLLETRRSDILYLSLSDFVQHVHAPEAPEAVAFMRAVDGRLARLLDLGAVIGIVADHGMTDMAREDGTPNVLFLGDELDAIFGPGATRVICPIADPFIRHHGALGGFVRVHLMRPDLDREAIAAFVRTLPGVALALVKEDACERFDLPADREADIAVVAESGLAIGSSADAHDLSQLAGTRLRSHGSLSEQKVPFILSHPLNPAYAARARGHLWNFDVFEFVLNGVA